MKSEVEQDESMKRAVELLENIAWASSISENSSKPSLEHGKEREIWPTASRNSLR